MSDLNAGTYTVEGRGPALFLVHGVGAARDVWRLMTPLLREHFTVITYDLRGHGQSPAAGGCFGLDELVADLEELRARLGVEAAHFAGHSLGGMIVPAYARLYPQRVLSLGLLSTAAGRTLQDRNKVCDVVRALEEHGLAQVLPTLAGRWFSDGFIAAHPDLVARRLQQVAATEAAAFLNAFRIYAETEMAPWLVEINVPALVLSGENDSGCHPQLNRFMATALPRGKSLVLPAHKHAILLEAPQAVAAHLISHMAAAE